MILDSVVEQALFTRMKEMAATFTSNYIEWRQDAAEVVRALRDPDHQWQLPFVECVGFSVAPNSNATFQTWYAASRTGDIEPTSITAHCIHHKDENDGEGGWQGHTLMRPGFGGSPRSMCEHINFTEAMAALPLPWGSFAYCDGTQPTHFFVSGDCFPVSHKLALPNIVIDTLDGQTLPAELQQMTILDFWRMVQEGKLVQVFDNLSAADGLVDDYDNMSITVVNPTDLALGNGMHMAANRPYVNMRRVPDYGLPLFRRPEHNLSGNHIEIHREMARKRQNGLAFLNGSVDF